MAVAVASPHRAVPGEPLLALVFTRCFSWALYGTENRLEKLVHGDTNTVSVLKETKAQLVRRRSNENIF